MHPSEVVPVTVKSLLFAGGPGSSERQAGADRRGAQTLATRPDLYFGGFSVPPSQHRRPHGIGGAPSGDQELPLPQLGPRSQRHQQHGAFRHLTAVSTAVRLRTPHDLRRRRAEVKQLIAITLGPKMAMSIRVFASLVVAGALLLGSAGASLAQGDEDDGGPQGDHPAGGRSPGGVCPSRREPGSGSQSVHDVAVPGDQPSPGPAPRRRATTTWPTPAARPSTRICTICCRRWWRQTRASTARTVRACGPAGTTSGDVGIETSKVGGEVLACPDVQRGRLLDATGHRRRLVEFAAPLRRPSTAIPGVRVLACGAEDPDQGWHGVRDCRLHHADGGAMSRPHGPPPPGRARRRARAAGDSSRRRPWRRSPRSAYGALPAPRACRPRLARASTAAPATSSLRRAPTSRRSIHR